MPAPALISAYISHPLLLPGVTACSASKDRCSLSKGRELLDSGSCGSEREGREIQAESCHVH